MSGQRKSRFGELVDRVRDVRRPLPIASTDDPQRVRSPRTGSSDAGQTGRLRRGGF